MRLGGVARVNDGEEGGSWALWFALVFLYVGVFGELEPIAAPFFSRGGDDSVIARQGEEENVVRRLRTRGNPSAEVNNKGSEGGGYGVGGEVWCMWGV